MLLSTIIFLHLSSVFCYAREKHPVLGGGCPLPQKPNNGDFEVSECIDGDFSSKCRKVPGTIVSQSVILQYQCNPGFELPDNIKYSICYNGVWDPEPSDCLKVCKGLSSNSLDLQCFYNGKEVDCGKPMIQGTKVRTACKDTYDIRDASASFITTECTSDGTWAKELYKCEPGCGKRNLVNTISTIKGDQFLDQYEFPWHAEIYVNDGSNFVSWCGGTIIHQKAILTAALCVYNGHEKRVVNESIFRVAVGKYTSNWNTAETTEQKFRVVQIIIPDKYNGRHNKNEDDIAILVLDRFITHSMPICFDRDEHLHLYTGARSGGSVVSWGRRETGGKISDALRVSRLQIIDFQDCLKKLRNTNTYVTYDKFCAKPSMDIGLKREDIGNALTFPRFDNGIEQHFIYGVVSLLESGIATITNVTEHMKWIEDKLDEII